MQLAAQLEALIVRRLKTGAKAMHVARALKPAGVTKWQVYKTAFIHGIKLKSGRMAKPHDPIAYAQYFDRRHGPGRAAYLLKRATEVTLQEVGKEFGWTSRERPRQHYYRLGGRRVKLAGICRKSELRRPDVTREKILELADGTRSVSEIAGVLNCSEVTVRQRLGGRRVKLPKKRQPLLRPDITIEAVRREAERQPSVLAITRALKVSNTTVIHRASQGSFELPNGRSGPKPKTVRILKAAARYRRRGLPFTKIAGIIGENPEVLYSLIRDHRSYFNQLLTPQRRPKAA